MQNGSVTSSKLATDSVTTPAITDNSVTAAKIASGQVVKTLNGFRDDVIVTAGSNIVIGSSGNTIAISSPIDWHVSGNSGPLANAFLGTIDNYSIALKVNNATALRIDPAANGPNVVGGLAAIKPTVITSGVRGAVVAGGGAPAGPVTGNGGGDFHAIYDSDGTIGGGFGNKVGNGNADVNDAPFGTVGGGVFNSAAAYASTVAGGDGNYAAGQRAAIGGGSGNQAFSPVSVIAGGQSNVILSNSPSATIAGGKNNSVSPGDFGYVSAKAATIGGGEGNTIFGLGGFPEGPLYNEYGTIGGGYSNTVHGSYGTVPGGYLNTAAGDFSFAAGSRAQADYGCFVWADASSTSPFWSTAANQFSIRAAGGLRLSDNTPSISFGSTTRQMLNLWGDVYGVGVQSGVLYSRCDGASVLNGFAWYRGGSHDDGYFNAVGGTLLMRLNALGLFVNVAFVSVSDRNVLCCLDAVAVKTIIQQLS